MQMDCYRASESNVWVQILCFGEPATWLWMVYISPQPKLSAKTGDRLRWPCVQLHIGSNTNPLSRLQYYHASVAVGGPVQRDVTDRSHGRPLWLRFSPYNQ